MKEKGGKKSSKYLFVQCKLQTYSATSHLKSLWKPVNSASVDVLFICWMFLWICLCPHLRPVIWPGGDVRARDIEGADRGSSSCFSVCQTEHCWQVEVPEINYRNQCGGGEEEKTLALECLWAVGMKLAYRENQSYKKGPQIEIHTQTKGLSLA